MTAYTTPELPRLIVNGSGKYKYVFTYKKHWVDGRSVRGKGDTQSVGKFVPDEDDKDKGEIFTKTKVRFSLMRISSPNTLRWNIFGCFGTKAAASNSSRSTRTTIC